MPDLTTSPAAFPGTRELSDSGFEMLRAAVNLARDGEFWSLASLRLRLGQIFPAQGEDIEQAIKFWASRERFQSGRK